MVQVPGCGCGGHCATVIPREGLCKPDGGSLIALVVVNCHGDETTLEILDASTGLLYAGPVVECSSFSICSDVEFRDGLCQPDGSPLVAVVVTSCDGTEITVNVLDPETGLPYAGPVIECNALTVADTDSIDLTLVDNLLSADLILDPASEAPVSITPDGLRVDCCDDDGGWTTQVKLTSQTFNSITPSDIAEMAGFTPIANAIYEAELSLISGSSSSAIAPQPRLNYPAGLTNVGSVLMTPDNTYTSQQQFYGGPVIQTAQTNAPAANTGFLQWGRMIIDVGPSPAAGNVRPQMASETGANVFVYRGSMFKWRRIA